MGRRGTGGFIAVCKGEFVAPDSREEDTAPFPEDGTEATSPLDSVEDAARVGDSERERSSSATLSSKVDMVLEKRHEESVALV